MRSVVLLLFQVSLLHKRCIHSPGMPPMAPIAAPLPGVTPLPLPPLPVGVSPPLITSGPPPLPQPIANGTPPTGIMQTLPGFSHPGVVKAFGTFLRKSVDIEHCETLLLTYNIFTHSQLSGHEVVFFCAASFSGSLTATIKSKLKPTELRLITIQMNQSNY